MKSSWWFKLASAAFVIGASAAALCAQDPSQVAYADTTASKAANPAPKKPRKVWTDDDVATVRSDSDKYLDEKRAQADQATAAAAAAAKQKNSAAATDKKVGGAAALSNPKSVDDADRMIAWEQRDIDAQTEFVEKVRGQLQNASTPEEREKLQQKLQQRIQILENVKQEQATLLDQKKTLHKKAAAGNAADAPAAQ